MYFPVRLRPVPAAGDYRCYLRRVAFGGFTVDQVQGGPTRVVRDSRLASAYPGEHVFLSVLRRGRCAVSQDGRTALLSSPGDFCFVDTARPFTEEFSTETEKVILHVPRGPLAARAPDMTHAMALTATGADGLGAAAAALVLALPAQRDDRPGDSLADAAGNIAVDLALGAVLEQAGVSEARPSRKAELLALAQRFMLDNQHVSGLSPADVARAISVSERHLFELFRETGCSPTAWLWAARLERAQRMLADPRYRHQTIGAIASLTGFASSSHFSRTFRERFSLSPREWRNTLGKGDGLPGSSLRRRQSQRARPPRI
jgi:AraC-like DNA-binding protein